MPAASAPYRYVSPISEFFTPEELAELNPTFTQCLDEHRAECDNAIIVREGGAIYHVIRRIPGKGEEENEWLIAESPLVAVRLFIAIVRTRNEIVARLSEALKP